MTRAFVDTSALEAVAFGEQHHTELRRVMDDVLDLFAAPLLEAEFRSVLAREAVEDGVRMRGTWPRRCFSPSTRVISR